MGVYLVSYDIAENDAFEYGNLWATLRGLEQRLAHLKQVSNTEFNAAYISDMAQIHDIDEKLFAQGSCRRNGRPEGIRSQDGLDRQTAYRRHPRHGRKVIPSFASGSSQFTALPWLGIECSSSCFFNSNR